MKRTSLAFVGALAFFAIASVQAAPLSEPTKQAGIVKQSVNDVSQALTANVTVASKSMLDQTAFSAVRACDQMAAYLPIAGDISLPIAIDVAVMKKASLLLGVADFKMPQTATFVFADIGVVVPRAWTQ